jgi:hypothetical protein
MTNFFRGNRASRKEVRNFYGNGTYTFNSACDDGLMSRAACDRKEFWFDFLDQGESGSGLTISCILVTLVFWFLVCRILFFIFYIS